MKILILGGASYTNKRLREAARERVHPWPPSAHKHLCISRRSHAVGDFVNREYRFPPFAMFATQAAL